MIVRKEIDTIMNALIKSVEALSESPIKTSEHLTDFYSVKEIEEKYHIKYNRLYVIIKESDIPFVTIAGHKYYSVKHIDKYFLKMSYMEAEEITGWYTIEDIQKIYRMTVKAVHSFTSRHKIPKKKEKTGNTTLYSKKHVDDIKNAQIGEDGYISIPEACAKMTRRYFLGIHLPEKPKNFAEREQVKSIMAKVEIMCLRVLEQLINEKYDFYDKVIENTDFLEYFHKEALKHNKKWLFVYQHFASFTNNQCTFADVNVALCARFRQYLMNTTKLKDKKVKLKQNSAAGYFSTFRGMLKDTYKRRLLKENINDFLDRIPEEETEIEYLTLDELHLVINSECPFPVLRKAFIFSCITGMRRSDVLTLQWRDIKRLPRGGWYINKRMIKTKSLANIPIGEDLIELIGPCKEGLVFKGLSVYMMTYPLKKWLKDIGIKKNIHYHCTRHIKIDN